MAKVTSDRTWYRLGNLDLRISYDLWPEEPATLTDPRMPERFEIEDVEVPSPAGPVSILAVFDALGVLDELGARVRASMKAG